MTETSVEAEQALGLAAMAALTKPEQLQQLLALRGLLALSAEAPPGLWNTAGGEACAAGRQGRTAALCCVAVIAVAHRTKHSTGVYQSQPPGWPLPPLPARRSSKARKRLAVPFRAADTPAERSESLAGTSGPSLLLTHLATYHSGLSEAEMREAVSELLQMGPSAQEEYYRAWLDLARGSRSTQVGGGGVGWGGGRRIGILTWGHCVSLDTLSDALPAAILVRLLISV
jgi:hypothetical protein